MMKNMKAQSHKYIRAIFVALTVCLFSFISGMVTPSFANEKVKDLIRHLDASKIRADILSQESIHKDLKRNSGDEKMGPGLKEYISQKVPGKSLSGIESDSVAAGNMVRLVLKTSDMTNTFSNRINPYGARVLRRKSGIVIVEVPRTKAEEMITEIDEIEYARKPAVFFPLEEVSEGVNLTGANAFHDGGVTGSGVKVAVIDSGFLNLSYAQLNGDIPNDVEIHDFSGKGLETEWAHGTEVAEIIHDMAPDAELHLLKVYDEVDIYEAFDYCLANDIDIVNMSIGAFGTGPGDGTGPLDEACDELRQNGILVVASAGNQAVQDAGNGTYFGQHYKGTFTDPGNTNRHYYYPNERNGHVAVIFSQPAWDDEGNELTNEVDILLRWNDWPTTDVDYGLFLNEFDLEFGGLVSSTYLAVSNAVQDGSQPPVEHITWDIPNDEAGFHYYAVLIRSFSENDTGIELELHLTGNNSYFFNGLYPDLDHTAILTSSSSIVEPADAESVFTVGAINQANWFTGPQEEFSSQGPTNAWAGSSARIKPDIMGPDGVSGYTLGDSSFFGTSAAAPHVAGAAALILSIDPDLSPDELQSFFESNAVDMGVPGKDNIYGWGRLNMDISDIRVPIGGEIKDENETPLCAMVLANGQHMFTCGANLGLYDLKVPLDENGRITLYGFCSGFSPFKTILTPEEASAFDITMARAPAGSKEIEVTRQTEPGTVNPERVRVSGTVYYGETPLCAMVLANGQSMFSCGANLGTFDMEVLLDGNGEITLYVFCSGFAPYKQVFAP